MIRINKLLRTTKFINKIPKRGGPGWDRPDVPPTQRVQTTTRWTHQQIIYTFFDASMPQFFLTQPEIYQGTAYEALPQFASIWGFLLGTAFSFWLVNHLINPTRKHQLVQPFFTNYFLSQYKRNNEDKIPFKYARQNPFGININAEQYPNQNYGKYFYPRRYFSMKASVQKLQTINSQAAEYLKKALQRARAPSSSNSQHHH